MALNLMSDVWHELKAHIPITDREQAADTLVNVLIDNDYDAAEIRNAFKGDNDVKRALESHLDDDINDDTEEELEDYDDDDEY